MKYHYLPTLEESAMKKFKMNIYESLKENISKAVVAAINQVSYVLCMCRQHIDNLIQYAYSDEWACNILFLVYL